MSSFLINVLASVVGGIFLLWAATVLSRKARWVLTGLLGRLLNIDIDYVFDNKDDAKADIGIEIKRARNVAIFASRGNELQRGAFASLFHEKPQKRQVRVRILLPQTALGDGEYDWVWQREAELSVFDKAYGKGFLRQQIEASVSFIQQYLDNSVELRRFNSPHIGRIIITERFAYYTPYRSDAHGRDSKVYKFRRGGEMHENLLRLFEQLWNVSIPHQGVTLRQAENVDVAEIASNIAASNNSFNPTPQ
jgi:hypothetical protein